METSHEERAKNLVRLKGMDVSSQDVAERNARRNQCL